MKKLIVILAINLGVFNLFSQNMADEIDYSVPRKFEIEKVEVMGADNLNKSIVLAFSGLAPGKEIYVPGDDITQAIKNLWKQKLFSDISIQATKIENGEISLIIKVKTLPRLSKYALNGVKKSEADKLRDEISLVKGEIFTAQKLINTEKQIRDYFYEKGYYQPEIDITSQPDSLFDQNSVRLNIEIKKGKKIKIEELVINGNTHIKDSKIRMKLKKTKEYNPWLFFRGSKYIDNVFEEDKISLINYYNSLGYRDARVLSDTIEFVDNEYLRLTLNLFEGDEYYYRNIKWTGNTKYSDKQLNAILGVVKGDIYNPEFLDKKLTMNPAGIDVSSLYMDNGYLFFSVRPVEVMIENDSIDLEIRIFEGPQATISDVTISGNLRTSDHVILRELRTRPGQKFNRSAIIRSQRELNQLGYFDPEQMNVIPTPNPEDGTVDLEYVVVEKPSDQLQLQGGWGAGQFVGSLGFVFSNFSTRKILKFKEWRPLPAGDGQRLSIRFQSNALYYSSFNFSFTEPWFGGKNPNSFTISTYTSVQSNGVSSGNDNRQEIRISGLTLGLGKRLKLPDDYFTLYNSVSFQRYVLNNYQYEFTFTDGYSNKFNFNHILSRNSIDQPIYPRSGSLFSLSLQWTPPFSLFSDLDYTTMTDQEKYKWMEYHKWKVDASWFLNVVDKLVLNTKMQFGFLGMYNPDIGITPFERFYVGGDGLSGYNLDGRELIALRGYENNSLTAESQTEKGGTIFNKYTFELRYPISLNPSATIYGLAFAEAGNSWLTFKEFNPFQVYRSLGVGIRIFMPMFGLLGFDWGYGFDDVPGIPSANGSNFHISIGQQF